MCDKILAKFQETIDKSIAMLTKKEHAIACQRDEITDLLNSLLPNESTQSSLTVPQDLSSLEEQLDTVFDNLGNLGRIALQNNENCSKSARRGGF